MDDPDHEILHVHAGCRRDPGAGPADGSDGLAAGSCGGRVPQDPDMAPADSYERVCGFHPRNAASGTGAHRGVRPAPDRAQASAHDAVCHCTGN